MSQNPYCGSGTKNRLEGALMDFFKGKLIAKVGAEAIFGIGIAPGIISKKGTTIYKFNI